MEIGVGRFARLVTVLTQYRVGSICIVVVPDDEGGGMLLLSLIMGSQLHRVSGVPIASILRSFKFGVVQQHIEFATGINRGAGGHVCGAVPFHHIPIGEEGIGGTGGGGVVGDSRGIVLEKTGCGRSVATGTGIIDKLNTIGTRNHLTPLGIKVEFLGNPETLGNSHSGSTRHRV